MVGWSWSELLNFTLKDLFLDLKYDVKYHKTTILIWFFLLGISMGIYFLFQGNFVGKVRFLGRYVDYASFLLIVWFTTNAIGDVIYSCRSVSIQREDYFTHPLVPMFRSMLWNGLAHISRVMNSIILFVLFGILGLNLIYLPILIFSYFYVLFLSLPYLFLIYSLGMRVRGKDFNTLVNVFGELLYTFFPLSYSFIELFTNFGIDVRILFLFPTIIYTEALRMLYFFGDWAFFIKILAITFLENFSFLLLSINLFKKSFELGRRLGLVSLE